MEITKENLEALCTDLDRVDDSKTWDYGGFHVSFYESREFTPCNAVVTLFVSATGDTKVSMSSCLPTRGWIPYARAYQRALAFALHISESNERA